MNGLVALTEVRKAASNGKNGCRSRSVESLLGRTATQVDRSFLTWRSSIPLFVGGRLSLYPDSQLPPSFCKGGNDGEQFVDNAQAPSRLRVWPRTFAHRLELISSPMRHPRNARQNPALRRTGICVLQTGASRRRPRRDRTCCRDDRRSPSAPRQF